MSSTMDNVETVATLKAALRTRIEALESAPGVDRFKKVYDYVGTSIEALFQHIPQLKLPCCVMWYSGSKWANKPRRTSRFHLFTIARKPKSWIDADATAIADLEALVGEFDWTLIADDHAKCHAASDSAQELDDTIACYDLELEIEDF